MENGGDGGGLTTTGEGPTAPALLQPPVRPASPSVIDREDDVSELDDADDPEDRHHFHQAPGHVPPMPPPALMMLPPPPAFVEPPPAFYHEHGGDHPNTNLGPPLPPPPPPLPPSMAQALPPEPLILNSTGDDANGNGEAQQPQYHPHPHPHHHQQQAPINPPHGNNGGRSSLVPPPADGFPFPGLRGFGVPPALFLRRQQAMLGANADNKRHSWTGEEDRRLKVRS